MSSFPDSQDQSAAADSTALPDAPAIDELRRTAVLLATTAADLARVRRREVGVGAGRAEGTEVKSSRVDPVTVVDTETEAHVRRLVAALRPGDAVFGEEEGDGDGSGATCSGVRWIVDPIDGTVNFLYGVPAYAVSVACEVDGAIVAGAVADIAGGRVFHAGLGAGAEVRAADGTAETLTCSAPADLGVSLVATGFAYDSARRSRQGRVVAELLGEVRDIRRIGSAALDLCLLAAGAVDCYYEHGLSLWDWAAGALIAREAGAVVKHPDPATGSPEGQLMAAAAPTVAEDFLGLLDRLGADGPIPAGE